jgi:protein tyrosine phosphatase
MRKLPTYRIWLGNVLDASNLRGVLDLGVELIVDLAANEVPPKITRDLTYCHIPLHDSMGNSEWQLRLAIDTVRLAVAKNIPTLVCCSAGMSRTPVIAAAAIALQTQQDFRKCLEALVAGAPHDVSAALVKDVLSLIE